MSRPKLRLSELRKIGWAKWDPIGLCEPDGRYPEGAADEYDSYLLFVAGLLINGKGSVAASEYLVEIAKDHMGLSIVDTSAADQTVQDVKRYLASLGYERI